MPAAGLGLDRNVEAGPDPVRGPFGPGPACLWGNWAVVAAVLDPGGTWGVHLSRIEGGTVKDRRESRKGGRKGERVGREEDRKEGRRNF